MKEDRSIANPAHVETSANEADGGSKSSRDGESKARTFTFANLAAATQNFKEENFLGEGGFGRVYKGRLLDTGEVSEIESCTSIVPLRHLLSLFSCVSIISSFSFKEKLLKVCAFAACGCQAA